VELLTSNTGTYRARGVHWVAVVVCRSGDEEDQEGPAGEEEQHEEHEEEEQKPDEEEGEEEEREEEEGAAAAAAAAMALRGGPARGARCAGRLAARGTRRMRPSGTRGVPRC
jgi:hypothetical protein